jgi:hypothetical protein
MWSWVFWWRPPCLLRRVILNLQHDATEALEGVLWSYRGGWLTLRDVSGLKAGQPATPIMGEVIVHRSNVAYTQVLP